MNRNFGKLTDGRLEYAPSVIRDGNKNIYTNDPEVLLRYGYKRIERQPYPTDGAEYRTIYTETEDTIIVGWERIEETQD